MKNNNFKKPFSLKHRLRSFKYASDGLIYFFRFEHNAKIHLSMTLIAILLATTLSVSSIEWCLILICIAIVLSAEAFNTAIEQMANSITLEIKPEIKIIKDVAAGAVLISAIFSLLIGAIIFVPKLISLI